MKFFQDCVKKMFLSVLVFSFVFSSSGTFVLAEGAGTELDPYQISTCEELQDINEDLTAHYIIVNNIECAETDTWNINLSEFENGDSDEPLIPDPYTGVMNNGYRGFNPIGRDDNINNAGDGFTGTLDGQGYTISNLWIFRKDESLIGLFGISTGGTIKDVTLNNARIVGSQDTGGFLGRGSGVTLEDLTNNQGMVRAYLSYNGGGIVGNLNLTSSGNNLTVTGGTVHGSGNVIGGLVGFMDTTTITNATTSADVDGGEYIGGAFGDVSNAQITNVTATGNVVSNSNETQYQPSIVKTGSSTGGFSGSIEASTVSNASATGTVTAEGSYTGGFAGFISGSTITDSFATGVVSGNQQVGGFAGSIVTSDFEDVYATGDVTATGSYVGGFGGEAVCGTTFLRAYASGNVTAGNSSVGGFTGIDGCEGPGAAYTQVAARGNVQGNNIVGGFVGESYSSVFTDVYSGGSVSANDQVGSFAATINNGTVTNAYARGLVILTDVGTLVGGFANDATNTVFTNSFWDAQAIDRGSACNTGACTGLTVLTTIQAKNTLTYTDAGWDFSTIWEMNTNNQGYPHFRWESFGPLPGSGTLEYPYQVTQCFDATESGYYELQNNITNVFGTCINIEADDVSINGGGHTITGDVQGGIVAIFGEGYDSIGISNITLNTFDDGIRLYNAQGTSIITGVTIGDTNDDGIELDGVSGMTISNSTITTINDEGITIGSYFDEANSTNVYNTGIVIQNLVISDTGDYGINLDYVTGLLVTENEIFDTDDDGISAYVIEDAQITDNSIHDVGSDGMYIEQAVDVLISENTIENTDEADGIDIDYDDYSYRVTVTDNVITNSGDVGIEISGLYGGTITGNTMSSKDEGIYVSNSEDLEFTENSIIPETSEFVEVPGFPTNYEELDILDADTTLSSTYNSVNYVLPFTFDYRGREITSIQASTNGSIELLEDGETCFICGDIGRYDQLLINDVIFASFDILTTENNPGDYLAIFSPDDEYVVVEWRGTTGADYDSVLYPVHFQVILYPDGEVRWNFIEMNFQINNFDMFTGAYDIEAGNEFRAGFEIDEPSSYRIDFSGDNEFNLVEEYDPITGLDLTNVNDSSFIGNSIHASEWVNAVNIENVVLNDSDSGNTYRLLNGDGAWTIFDIVDTNGNGYAESGADRPFNKTVLGNAYWNGEGEDAYPATVNRQEERRSRSSSGSTQLSRQKAQRDWGPYYKQKNITRDDDDKKSNLEDQKKNTVEDIPTMCPADQILTQNLRAPSRNGAFNSYTKGVVKEAKVLQAHLNRLGFNSGPEDGILGPISIGAIKRMQIFLKTTPDGYVGPITRGLINRSCGGAGLQAI